MSQSSTQKQTSLAQQGHRVFDLVRKFAKAAQEIEATLTSTTGEFLRFGNNELGQSQFTKSRTLSVRLASGKKQARTTTGRLDESFIQKAVEKAVDQLKTAPGPRLSTNVGTPEISLCKSVPSKNSRRIR